MKKLEKKPDIAGMISAMQQQLVVLERKLDTLINQPQRVDQPRRHSEARQDNDYRERTMHKAVCADCKIECEVPFRPTGGRPVYCKECFSKRKSDSPFKEKHDSRPRQEEPAKEHFYDKFKSGGRRKSVGKKKPSFRKHK